MFSIFINSIINSVVILYSLGQMGRIQIMEGVALYAYEVLIVIWTFTLIIKYRTEPLKYFYRHFKWTFRFLLFLFITLFISYSWFDFKSNIVATLYYLRLLIYFVWFIYVRSYIASHDGWYRKASRVITWLMAWVAGTSIAQYLFYPDLRTLMRFGWDPHLNRMVGLYLEPPVAGAIYGLILLYAFFYVKSNRTRNIITSVFFICLLLTYSRGSYFAAVVTIFVMMIRKIHLNMAIEATTDKTSKKHWNRFILIVLLGGLVFMSFLPKEGEGMDLWRTSTVYSRLANYEEAMSIFEQYPIIGVGYNHIGSVRTFLSHAPYPDHSAASFQSSFLIILITSGVIGLLLFLRMLYEFMELSIFTEYAVLYLGVASLTDNVILHPIILFILFFFIVSVPDKLIPLRHRANY